MCSMITPFGAAQTSRSQRNDVTSFLPLKDQVAGRQIPRRYFRRKRPRERAFLDLIDHNTSQKNLGNRATYGDTALKHVVDTCCWCLAFSRPRNSIENLVASVIENTFSACLHY